MEKRRAQPPAPRSPAPMAMEEVDIVRRRLAPPAGPPPASMLAAFKGPRRVAEPEGGVLDQDTYRDDRDGYSDRSRSHPRYDSDDRDPFDSPTAESKDGGSSSRWRDGDASGRRRGEDDDNDDIFDEDRGPRGKGAAAVSRMIDLDESSEDEEAVTKLRIPSFGAAESKVQRQESKETAGQKKADSGSRLAVFNFSTIMQSTYRELRAFVMNPAPSNVVVRCYIERHKGMSNMLTPVYSLCADLEDGTGRELIVCRKMPSRSPHYVFSLKSDDLYRKRDQRSKLYLGKLRLVSNNEYVLYDNGALEMPDGKGGADAKAEEVSAEEAEGADNSLYRSQLVSIAFNSKKRPCAFDERGMEVCIASPSIAKMPGPTPETTPQHKVLIDISEPFRTMREEGNQNNKFDDKFIVFHERVSRYDALSACLVDFKGRASIASVKNFQLILSEPASKQSKQRSASEAPVDPSAISLQMGKVGIQHTILQSCCVISLYGIICSHTVYFYIFSTDNQGCLQYGLQSAVVDAAVLCDMHRQIRCRAELALIFGTRRRESHFLSVRAAKDIITSTEVII